MKHERISEDQSADKNKGHDYTISTLDVLKACDACADIGQLQCSVPIL